MDSRKDVDGIMRLRECQTLDPPLWPLLYLGYRTTLSEGPEIFRNNIRERWLNYKDLVAAGIAARWDFDRLVRLVDVIWISGRSRIKSEKRIWR